MPNPLIALLNQSLAETIDLKLQAKQAHWNVKGTNFIALHNLFDALATEIETYADMLAERVVQLGGIAQGTLQGVHAASTLPAYPDTILQGALHINALVAALKIYVSKTNQLIDTADKQGDAVTADLLTEVARGLDKQRWFVEAHAQI